MLVSDRLRIVNVTLHVSLRRALQMINKQLVLKAIRAADKAVRSMGIQAPQMAVAGLNPHAGEQGMFGTEEIEDIEPAILQAQRKAFMPLDHMEATPCFLSIVSSNTMLISLCTTIKPICRSSYWHSIKLPRLLSAPLFSFAPSVMAAHRILPAKVLLPRTVYWNPSVWLVMFR